MKKWKKKKMKKKKKNEKKMIITNAASGLEAWVSQETQFPFDSRSSQTKK